MTISSLSAATTLCEALHWEVSNLELQKLLYIAHVLNVGRHDEPLVNEQFEAWNYGPVLPSLYQKAKYFGSGSIEYLPSVHRNINRQEHRLIKEVAASFGEMTPGQLVDLTHSSEGAWYRRFVPGIRNIVITTSDARREYGRRQAEFQQLAAA